MEIKYLKLERVTKENFDPYGEVLGLEEEGKLVEMLPHLRYWANNAYLGEINEKLDMGLIVNTLDEHGYEFEKLERHPKTWEIFFPLEGQSVFVMAPPNKDRDYSGIQFKEQIKAFLISGNLGVGLCKGTWHWAPRPIGEFSKMALLRKGELTEPTEFVELGMKVKIVL